MLTIIGIIMFLISGTFVVTDEEGAGCVVVLLSFIFVFCGIVFNPTETETIVEETNLYSAFNTTELSINGGLFYTSSENSDYLVFWEDNGSYKTRRKISIDWNKTKVYETNDVQPKLEKQVRRKFTDTMWEKLVDLPFSEVVAYILTVPEGTVIERIELK